MFIYVGLIILEEVYGQKRHLQKKNVMRGRKARGDIADQGKVKAYGGGKSEQTKGSILSNFPTLM